MQIKEVMTTDVEVIRATESLQSAAQRMRSRDIGILPVHDNGQAVGMVTDRDITIRGVAEGKDPQRTSIRDVMTPNILSLQEDQDVVEAARLMQDQKVRRALVLASDQTIAGIVSLGDLATRIRGKQEGLSGEVLQQVSEPGAA